MYNDREYQSVNIKTATTTDVFTGKGILGSIIINAANGGGTATISDQATTPVVIGTVTISGSPYVAVPYNIGIAGGLRIVTSASPDITITYAKG